MHDIFIAHAGNDRALAEALYDELSPHAECFLDTRRLLPGDNWDRVIAKAQRESSMTVVIVTAASGEAYYESEEVATAIAISRAAPEKHRVIPLVYSPDGDEPLLPLYGLLSRHAITIADRNELPDAAKTILETLAVTRKDRERASSQAAAQMERLVHDESHRPAAFAFLAAFDIKNFSGFNANDQVAVYTTLQLAISDALADLGMEISKKITGKVFWSQGGDGGILSQVDGDGTSILRLALLTFSMLRSRITSGDGPGFQIVAALDCGLVHIRADMNGAPNIWGEPPNRVHRALEACEPGELLASGEFVDQIRSQTSDFADLIGPRRMRATKHDRLLRVHCIATDGMSTGSQSNELIDIIDFEAPNREMLGRYQSLARGATDSGSGVWSLLLARKRHDLQAITDAELRHVVRSVSLDGRKARANSPYHPLFSSFPGKSLIHAMTEGTFRHFAAEEQLCEAGDEASEMYIVAEGHINVMEDGELTVTRGPGELIGEMALVEPVTQRIQTGPKHRSASLVAACPTTVFAIPYGALLERTDEVSSALVGYYRRRRKQSILAADDTLRPLLHQMCGDDCDSLIDAARLCGLGSQEVSRLDLQGPSLVVAGTGIVRLQADDGTERTLQEVMTRPILLEPAGDETQVQLAAVRDSEFAYLDHDGWALLSRLASDREATPRLTANVDRWSMSNPTPVAGG